MDRVVRGPRQRPHALGSGHHHLHGKLRLFVRGTDNKIYINVFDGSSWTGWSEVPGGGATPDAPGVVKYKKKALRLFVRGTDNRIYVNRLSR